jgi:hypothetical protein
VRASWLLLAGLCLPLVAQAEASRPKETADAVLIREDVAWPRILHDSLGLPDWLDLAVEQRTRFEWLDEPFRGGEPNTQSQVPQRTRLRLGIDAPAGFRFLAELQDSRTWGDGPNDFTGSEIDKVSFAQLFASWTQRELLGSQLRADLHVGRMSLDFGSRRLVARNGFRNTTNAFDGVHLSLGEGALWHVRAFWTRPVQLDPDYFEDKSEGQQRFWGAAYEDKRIPWLNFDVYYFGLHDRIVNSSTLGRSYETFGARALRAAKAAQWDYELELIGQFGQRTVTRADVPTQLDQEAFAGHAELGYTFAALWSPRLVGQFEYGSGTANPTGDESQTFDPLFGGRRGDLIPTGIYGPFRRSNIVSPGVRLQLTPRPDLKAFLKLRYWRLAQEKDAFVGTGLSDPSGNAGSDLGTDIELSAQWTPRPWLTLETGYDHWFKGSYLSEVPPPTAGPISSDDSDYLYFSVQFRI